MCTPPVIQFTVQALSGYLRNTEVTNFFNVQVCVPQQKKVLLVIRGNLLTFYR